MPAAEPLGEDPVSLFRPTYRVKGEGFRSPTWWIQFRDHKDVRRKIRGLADRRATEAMEQKLKHLATPGAIDHFEIPRDSSCAGVALSAAAHFKRSQPHLMLVHFADPDDAGHASGWGSDAYVKALAASDKCLGVLLDAIDASPMKASTLIIVTSDHGPPFPRAKGQAYDFSNRVPLAVMWKKGIKSVGRVVDDYVSFADLAPTLVELAGLSWNETGMQQTVGRSLTDILFSAKAGRGVSQGPVRAHVLVGKERHDVGRPNDVGYPIRGISKNDVLYIRNYEVERWPAGNPETGYLNCDGGATKTEILQARRAGRERRHWELAFGKRPAEELYDLKQDPDCLHNLADDPNRRSLKELLRRQMERELRAQGDPRMFAAESRPARPSPMTQPPRARSRRPRAYCAHRALLGETCGTMLAECRDDSKRPPPKRASRSALTTHGLNNFVARTEKRDRTSSC